MISRLKPFYAFFLFILGITYQANAQRKFEWKELNNPIANSHVFEENLITSEVHEYSIPSGNCVVLENGFRQSNFINEQIWLSIKDTVTVDRVEVIFSKYPYRNGKYNEIYNLLSRRIQATIKMDPSLNADSIKWHRVWQTHCVNNQQVDALFHGVVIWYDLRPTRKTIIPNTDQLTKEDDPLKNIELDEETKNEEIYDETQSTVDFIASNPLLPDSIKAKINGKPLDVQSRILNDYFTEIKATDTAEEKGVQDELTRLQYLNEIEQFIEHFPKVEPIVSRVLDRHPEWLNKIVVNDWTGSMYSYGSQVLTWHLMNIDSSNINTITLFNDGNNKSTKQKVIGRTGGIYTEPADNAEELIDLFSVVMSNGGGGDGPENDIEAILKAIEKQPLESEIVLIADNRACVRDIELAHLIQRPVRIILCGYDPEEGVNAHYIYLAKLTGGGIYTIEEDIEDVETQIGSNGEILNMDDDRLNLASSTCINDPFTDQAGRIYSLKNARFNKKNVRILDASEEGLSEIPNYIFKMYRLQALDLHNNFLTSITGKISSLRYLSSLDLSQNAIAILPQEFERLDHIENLNLSTNAFQWIPYSVCDLEFLKNLDVSYNQLSKMDKLKSRYIRSLNVSHNQLNELPSLKRQFRMYELNASHNQLSEFPKNLPLNRELRVLDLSHNQLTSLPDDLSNFQRLRILDLSGNNFSTEEQERIRKDLFFTDLRF
jgi:Leucine-rich repeat (LRR) protein